MIKKVIINKNNMLALEYLVDNFAGCGIKFKLKPSELFNSLSVEVDSELFESFLTILAKAIIGFPVFIFQMKCLKVWLPHRLFMK